MFRPTDQHFLPHLVPLNQDLKPTISAAKPIFHKSITTFSSLREDVRSDLLNIDKVTNEQLQNTDVYITLLCCAIKYIF